MDYYYFLCFFFFKQKTAYEMVRSDWSSDVCSSDLQVGVGSRLEPRGRAARARRRDTQPLPDGRDDAEQDHRDAGSAGGRSTNARHLRHDETEGPDFAPRVRAAHLEALSGIPR